MNLERFNDNQKKAIKHIDGPMIVVAGPGSGKTTVITNRIIKLIKNDIVPSDILVVTFTKASGIEMEKRFLDLIDKNDTNVTFSTFHKLFYRILRSLPMYKNVKIISEYDSHKICRDILSMLISNCDEDTVKLYLQELTLFKSDIIPIENFETKIVRKGVFSDFVEKYEQYKEQNNYIDFDDMNYKCYQELSTKPNLRKYWENKYKYILVDEFQDINAVQYEILSILAKTRNLFVVGDDDQTIYSFRGSSPRFLLEFDKKFKDTKKIYLDTNYRSTNAILALTNKVIDKNTKRFHKEMKAVKTSKNNPVLMTSDDEKEEAKKIVNKIMDLYKMGVDFENIAILYRVNNQGFEFVTEFMDRNIPFVLKDNLVSYYEHFIFKDFINYYKASVKQDSMAMAEIINKPNRYLSRAMINDGLAYGGNLIDYLYNHSGLESWRFKRIDEFVFYLNALKKKKPYEFFKYFRLAVGYDEYIQEYADSRKIKPFALIDVMDYIQNDAKNFETFEEYFEHIEKFNEELKKVDKSKTGVTLATLHSAKGLEFDTVFVASVVDGVIPYEKSITDSEIEEERRLLYVGLTRAKERLFISNTKFNRNGEAELSDFIYEVIKKKK